MVPGVVQPVSGRATLAHFDHHSGDVVLEMKHASVDAVSGRAMLGFDRLISYQGYNDV